jgi:hypothetical protein
MATTSTPAPPVSVTDAAREAIEHTRRTLFPIRIEKWLILGFLAFLDQCGRTLNGGGPGGRGGGSGPSWPGRGGRGAAEDVAEALRTASAWLSEHAVEVTIGGIVGLVLLTALIAVVLWLNARGTFMYLDNVASGRAEISRPWREHAHSAQSYFGWRFGLALATFGVLLFAASLVLVAGVAFVRGRLEDAAGGVTALALVPVLLLLLLALPLLALAGLALRDFVAPLQIATGLSCGQAARVLEGLIVDHPGAFLVYLLLKLVLYAVTGVVVVVGGCLTCCLGFLPVVLQTVFQPLFFFERAWSVFLLRRMGHDVPARLGGGSGQTVGRGDTSQGS